MSGRVAHDFRDYTFPWLYLDRARSAEVRLSQGVSQCSRGPRQANFDEKGVKNDETLSFLAWFKCGLQNRIARREAAKERSQGRGRDGPFGPPPAQIRT